MTAAKALSLQKNLTMKARLFKGFADASRLSILEVLREGERSVNELTESTGLSQANVSSHLSCLLQAGLVSKRSEGKYNFYSIRDHKVLRILADAEEILREGTEEAYQCINTCFMRDDK